MCLYPRLIRNKKYTPNKKNGGIIPAIFDTRVLATPIGCGECIECRKQKAREWQVRLLEEVRTSKDGHFITLTFTNESLTTLYNDEKIKYLKGYELDNAAATLAVRRFLERWRKQHKKSLRHWLITELGHKNTERIHLHGIAWTSEQTKEIQKHWQYGKVWAGYENKRTYVTEKTVNYITKYITKVDLDHKYYKGKILTSAGIGGNYINREDSKKNKYIEEKTKETYTTRTGHEVALPIYYRNKTYTDEEKEKLWIEKLNKKIRWVDKKKIDISKNEEEYNKALAIARQKNNRLGYGGIKEWKEELYEKQKRTLIQNKIKNNSKEKNTIIEKEFEMPRSIEW